MESECELREESENVDSDTVDSWEMLREVSLWEESVLIVTELRLCDDVEFCFIEDDDDRDDNELRDLELDELFVDDDDRGDDIDEDD